MKKVLIADDLEAFRNFLTKKLTQYQIDVITVSNGLEGSAKIRTELPDLVILSDNLTRRSYLDLLEDIRKNPNVKTVPVILIAEDLDKKKLAELSKFSLKKIFTKPLKFDLLLESISSILAFTIYIDREPCRIDAHFNDDILFIEVSEGLNYDKIDLLDFKISELIHIYQMEQPKILIMFSGFDFLETDIPKLNRLLEIVKERSGTRYSSMYILTKSKPLKSAIYAQSRYKNLPIVENLEHALDALIGMDGNRLLHKTQSHAKLLTQGKPAAGRTEAVQFRYEIDKKIGSRVNIAVVDDDFIIRDLMSTIFQDLDFYIKTFADGKEFANSLRHEKFDLIFLDLIMPGMNGFQVMELLKRSGTGIPVIILSSLTQKETVLKAREYGIVQYLIKPVTPDIILKKTHEIFSDRLKMT